MQIRIAFALAALVTTPVFAQLATPSSNRSAAMGHLHLNVSDVDAQKKFWVGFGGTVVKNGPLEMVQLPGVYIILRKQEPTGGSVGSVVNHVGFNARNSAETVAKWKAAGLNPEAGNQPGQFFLTTADGVRVELLEDKSIPVPLQFHHIHFNVTADQAAIMQAWYERSFGARPGMRGRYLAGDIGGANLTFADSKMKMAPTKGRALDHIGFEVTDLDLFATKLKAQGIDFNVEPRAVPNSNLKIAFVTDPWGTYIEITQGLDVK